MKNVYLLAWGPFNFILYLVINDGHVVNFGRFGFYNLCLCVCVSLHVLTKSSDAHKPEESIGSPKDRVTGYCEPLYMGSMNQILVLEKQQALLSPESSLQPWILKANISKICYHKYSLSTHHN